MPDTGWALLGLLIFLGVLGAVGACFAWRMASKETEREPKIEVLVGIGGALITGIAVGVSVLYLQQALEESQKYAAWRANVEIAASIPGFSPAGRDIKAINFSGKALHNADLKGADLRNAQLRDTDLTGADLTGAKLQGANLIGANLYETNLTGAHLDDALLQSANLTHAVIDSEGTTFHGATVDARTCWPENVVQEKVDSVNVNNEGHDGFRGGEKAPDCSLWKAGHRAG
ncbi:MULTISPECIES: pentapeptide repeat-containing protein [unclassified Streptomyces]|uniref:pentapeptide repeat-containing protein n=1 Tax=unclassified Streptomyces TaxID=2593676 RepID=UPI002E33398F|nr:MULTISPECIES: pentapeptide repeat-containing protein [unclassified Streptomyces]